MKVPPESVPPSPAADQAGVAETPLDRYIPLLAWLIVLVTLIAIPLQIIKGGFLPGGDARRHVAQAFTNKTYPDILLLHPGYSMSHSPGWEGLLKFLHRTMGWDRDALVSFSVVGLMLCVFCAPLPWLRRPEAWLAALLVQMLAIPEVMNRISQARPFLLTEGMLITILFGWGKLSEEKPSGLKIILTCIGISLSVWMHGAWYLWILPVIAFLLAGSWRAAFWLAACIAVGVVTGAMMTGKPFVFLLQAVAMASSISHEHLPQRLVVGEFQPSYGELDTLLVLAAVMLWRWFQKNEPPRLRHQPIFCMLVLCWVGGLKADRFWADWGVPAAIVWLTLQFEELLPAFYAAASPKRLLACGLIALPLFLHATNDLGNRYSFSLSEYFLDANDPSLAGWLPEKNGIFYNAQMEFFYNTFYKNPDADWRYMVGFEPSLAPDADRKILRNIQWNNYAFKAYEPWIAEMRPSDRLVIYSPGQPNLSQLEWHNAGATLWLGRLPKSNVAPNR